THTLSPLLEGDYHLGANLGFVTKRNSVMATPCVRDVKVFRHGARPELTPVTAVDDQFATPGSTSVHTDKLAVVPTETYGVVVIRYRAPVRSIVSTVGGVAEPHRRRGTVSLLGRLDKVPRGP